MTTPEPSGPTADPAVEPEAPAAATSEPATDPAVPPTEPVAPVEPEVVAPVVEDTSAEDASDAQLRAWAKDNGIEDVPASGKLSASWREQITNAMALALAADPKEEGSATATSPESSTSTETKTETGSTEPEPAPYRTPWEAPETWVTGQSYTA